jgi:hypothetical protein
MVLSSIPYLSKFYQCDAVFLISSRALLFSWGGTAALGPGFKIMFIYASILCEYSLIKTQQNNFIAIKNIMEQYMIYNYALFNITISRDTALYSTYTLPMKTGNYLISRRETNAVSSFIKKLYLFPPNFLLNVQELLIILIFEVRNGTNLLCHNSFLEMWNHKKLSENIINLSY